MSLLVAFNYIRTGVKDRTDDVFGFGSQSHIREVGAKVLTLSLYPVAGHASPLAKENLFSSGRVCLTRCQYLVH